MAITFSQLPGELNVTFVQSDEVSMAVSVDRDITGYQLVAPIYTTQVFAVGGGGRSSGTVIGEVVDNWTVSVSDAAAGELALGLTEAQTSDLTPATGYRWFLRWVDTAGYTRTVLSGDLTVRTP